MYNVYASAGYSGYLYPLLRTGKFKEVDDIMLADLVLFAGGADIDPGIYGQEMGSHTYINPRRDTIEIEDYHTAKNANIPMVGICRGMQLITALEGGNLFQHVDNHAGYRHDMVTVEGEQILVNSLHHQMCNPWAGVKDFTVIGWTPSRLAGTIIGAGDLSVAPPPVEPEAIYYPNSNAFCVQWHPEMMSPSRDSDRITINWYTNHVEMLMEDTIHERYKAA